MLDELRHECGIAALYLLNGSRAKSPRSSKGTEQRNVTPLIPYLLLDIQNRGQLAAGLSSYDPSSRHMLKTYKEDRTYAIRHLRSR